MNFLVEGVTQWTLEMEKQVGYRVGVVMNNPMLLSVLQQFGPKTFHRSSVFHGLEEFLRLNNVRGKCCYEVGTWNGLTAAVLSQFFDEVVTVDVAHNPQKHLILDYLGIKNVRCIDIAGNHEKPKTLHELTIDCAFLDGNHAADTESDFDLVRHCGRVIFHEVWPFQSPVWGLTNALPQDEVTRGGVCFALWQRKAL